jgi:hypothetical protein
MLLWFRRRLKMQNTKININAANPAKDIPIAVPRAKPECCSEGDGPETIVVVTKLEDAVEYLLGCVDLMLLVPAEDADALKVLLVVAEVGQRGQETPDSWLADFKRRRDLGLVCCDLDRDLRLDDPHLVDLAATVDRLYASLGLLYRAAGCVVNVENVRRLPSSQEVGVTSYVVKPSRALMAHCATAGETSATVAASLTMVERGWGP